MKQLSQLVLVIAGITCIAIPAMAQTSSAAPTEQPAKKPKPKKTQAAKQPVPAEEAQKEPETQGMLATPYSCELGNSLTIYTNANDDQQIALRWNKRLHSLTRVSTTTGAQRFENPKEGLVWIGIPAKGMLLDSKKGRQLANECKNADQTAKSVEKS